MDPLKVIMRALYAPHEDYMGMARSMGVSNKYSGGTCSWSAWAVSGFPKICMRPWE